MRLHRRSEGVNPSTIDTSRPHSPLLDVDGLVVRYATDAGDVTAVEDVSFSLRDGEAMGLVGESGCGKSSVALSLLRLAPENAHYPSGEIRWEGADLLGMPSESMRRLRWAEISMVFQGAMNAWNPVYRVGQQIREAMDQHFDPRLTTAETDRRLTRLFETVGLDVATADRYPHELSGGMRQRALIAMALSCDPKLIVADEPTTALDVIVQAQILRELRKIQTELGLAILYISHDMAVIAQVTDTVAVMYAGRLVESGPTKTVFRCPRHPYTHLLLSSIPSVTGPRRQPIRLHGTPPDPMAPPSGCHFHPRCPWATDLCRRETPPLEPVGSEHLTACWHTDRVPASGEPV